MQSIWIIGAGKFGQKTACILHKKHPNSKITIIDKSNSVCSQLSNGPYKTICMDGIDFLSYNLKESNLPDWIVPSIPIHVAYEWIIIKLEEKYNIETIKVPVQVAQGLPNVFKGDKGQIYCSNADFICPSNCNEPDKICTFTGKPRSRILYQTLKSIKYGDYNSVVIQSHQLYPGVGGISPKDLFNALKTIKSSNHLVFLSTACSCHGVMHAFKVFRKKI